MRKLWEVELGHEIDAVDYGPLCGLIGGWRGDKGMDVAPEIRVDTERLSYERTTVVDIYGKRFDLTDANVLTREA